MDARARLLPLDAALDGALDRYTFMRDTYLQLRTAQLGRGGDGENAAYAGAPE